MKRLGKLLRRLLRDWLSPVIAERDSMRENRYRIVLIHLADGYMREQDLYTALQKESLRAPDLRMPRHAFCSMLSHMKTEGLISSFSIFAGDPSGNGYESRYEITVRGRHFRQGRAAPAVAEVA